MIPRSAFYNLKLLDYPGQSVTIDGQKFNRKNIDSGFPCHFDALEMKTIEVKE